MIDEGKKYAYKLSLKSSNSFLIQMNEFRNLKDKYPKRRFRGSI